MAKKKLYSKIKSFGLYTRFDPDSRDLPRVLRHTLKIPASLDVEFGYILHIKGGKGRKLDFTIEHPPFTNDADEIAPPFTGEVYIDANDFSFFLGDTIWPPVEDKIGPWRLITRCEGTILADKTLQIVPAEETD